MREPGDKPKTISEKEKETLNFWQKNKIFQKSIETPAGRKPKGGFSFYDGPPFATGLPHHGTIMAGTVKDVIPRYQTMKGNSVRRIWGWDCHGLPIENLIEKKLGLESKKDIEEYGVGKFNKEAEESVLQYEKEWKDIIPRFGRWVDMDNAYKTMDATYTESIWWAWKELIEGGLAYEGNKMMHICPRCETPLAQSEVGLEYADVTDISVTVRFKLSDEKESYILAWTTTPWTLPGNTALAVNENIDYVKLKRFQTDEIRLRPGVKLYDELFYYVSKKFFQENFTLLDKKDLNLPLKDQVFIRYDYLVEEDNLFQVVEELNGGKLVGKKYTPPFLYFKDTALENKENLWKIWHADFVTEETGTGIAHEAPAFGLDDMELANKNNIPIIKHVKMDGTFTEEVKDFAGMKVKKKDDTQSADIEIIKWLAHNHFLFGKQKIVHSYPLCWRCKTPLLNYATSSWFVDVPKIKDKLIKENKKIVWVPKHIRDGRFGKWLEGAREWAISRTRYWGAPLPVWKSESGDIKIIGSLKELAKLNKNKSKNNHYVIRHGGSLSNEKGILEIKGDPGNHLTEKGKEQIKKQIEKLRGLKINCIITSPFLRAKETTEIIRNALGINDVVVDERLRENNLGIYDGFTISKYLEANGKTDFLRYSYRPEGGENHKEIMDRVMASVYGQEKENSGKNILYVTHGGPARMMLAGAKLATEEEVIEDEGSWHSEMYLKNGEFKKLDLQMVPRDKTGAINLHRPYIDEIKLEIDGKVYKRIEDVFDCWFESGSMPFASLHYPFENKKIFKKNYPADFIAESMDQTRGWFYSLINLGVGLFNEAPYKHVICNGIINGSDGQKISKSLNNYSDPLSLIEKFGADALRYYLMSSPVIKGENINFKDEELEDVYKKLILRLENVMNLYEMNKPDQIFKSNKSKDTLNRWIVSRVHQVHNQATKGLDSYELDEASRPFSQFIDDLSVWYVRRARGRLKGDEGTEVKKETYETLAYVLNIFARTIAPVMPFIAERIYKQTDGEKESVHLESWREVENFDKKIIEEMEKVRGVVSFALMERTKKGVSVKQPLRSLLITTEIPKDYHQLIKDEVNVKEIIYEPADGVKEAQLDFNLDAGLIQEGDIRIFIRAIQDARKEKGLSPKDIISLSLSSTSNLGDLSQLKMICKISEIKENTNVNKHGVELSFGTLYFSIT